MTRSCKTQHKEPLPRIVYHGYSMEIWACEKCIGTNEVHWTFFYFNTLQLHFLNNKESVNFTEWDKKNI